MLHSLERVLWHRDFRLVAGVDIWLNTPAGVKYITRQYKGDPEELLNILYDDLPLNLTVNRLLTEIFMGRNQNDKALTLTQKLYEKVNNIETAFLYIEILRRTENLERADEIRKLWRR